MIIDAHTHVIPKPYLLALEKRPDIRSSRVHNANTDHPSIQTSGVTFDLSPVWFDADRMVEYMDSNGIDAHVISTPTFLFHYSDPIDDAITLTRIINDSIADFGRRHPNRFFGMATVPLQDIDVACAELGRMHSQLNIRAVEIGTFVNGKSLDDRSLRPFFEEAQRLGVFVFVHPLTQEQVGKDVLELAYLRNLIGLPLGTSFAIEAAIFGGLLDQLPQLKLGFAHGGGTSAILLDRWDRHWAADPSLQALCLKPPSEHFRSLYLDTVSHSTSALEMILQKAAPNRLILGSDTPADMGTPSFPGPIKNTSLYREHADEINFKTILSLVG